MRVLLLVSWFFVAVPYSAQALTLADLLVPGTTASAGDLVFSNVSLLGPANPSLIDVTLLPMGFGLIRLSPFQLFRFQTILHIA
jgi:hypothetical protein